MKDAPISSLSCIDFGCAVREIYSTQAPSLVGKEDKKDLRYSDSYEPDAKHDGYN